MLPRCHGLYFNSGEMEPSPRESFNLEIKKQKCLGWQLKVAQELVSSYLIRVLLVWLRPGWYLTTAVVSAADAMFLYFGGYAGVTVVFPKGGSYLQTAFAQKVCTGQIDDPELIHRTLVFPLFHTSILRLLRIADESR